MRRVTGHNAITVGIVSIISVYMGVNFFQPIVIERLRKDGNLRQDIDLPHFNPDGTIKVTDDFTKSALLEQTKDDNNHQHDT